jgi:hypothetical protein
VSIPDLRYWEEDEQAPSRASDTVAGFLAAFAIFASLIALAWHPLRLVPISMVLALVAAAMGGRHQRLAFAAAMIAGLCFFLGMAIAVLTQRPLW